MQESHRLRSLFELRGVQAEFDSEISKDGFVTGDGSALGEIGVRLRAVEEKFKMIWEYPYGGAGISDFNTCLLGAIRAANDANFRPHGSVADYRRLRSRANLIFREFYKSRPRDIVRLDQNLVECVRATVHASSETHLSLVDIYY